jgi:hypothetical protein
VQKIPASVGQRLLWLMDHYRAAGNGLNEQVLMRVGGRCDSGVVREAVQRLSARHGSLRTSFADRGARLSQLVRPEPHPVELREVDISGAADRVAALRAEISGELVRAVDPAGVPLRPTLVHIDGGDHMLVLTMHHFVTDDWSNALISRDIRHLYNELDGVPNELPALPDVEWQYGDWAVWQHELLNGGQRAGLDAYWRDKLAGARLAKIARPAAPPDAAGERDWRSAKLLLDAAVTASLQRLARSRRTTLFPVMLALFTTLLHEMTGQDDLTVSSLFANRGRSQVRETVGFFISTLLLRCELDPDQPFTELVDAARGTVMGAIRHQDLPYQLLPPDTVETNNGRADEVTFQFLGSLTTRADMVGNEHENLDLQDQVSGRRFTLEFILVPEATGGGLYALLLCDRAQFGQPWADEFVRRYVELAQRAAAEPAAPVSRLIGRRI